MKKKLSVILIFALVFSLMGSFAAPASAAVSNLYGDLNGDGVVASADSVLMKRYLAEWNVTIDTLEAGDLNGDGNVTSADSVILSRYLAKWEFENKVGTPIVVGLPDITVTMTLPEITVNNSAKISCDVKTFGTPELSYVYVSENPDAVSVSSDGTVTAKTTAPTDVTVYVRAYYEKEGKTLTGTASVTVKAKDASEKVNVLDSSRKELFLLADTSENGALDTLVSGISDRLGMDASVSSGAALGSGDYSIVLDLKTATAESLGLTAAELNSDGFMLKASGNTLYILANNPDGADRAVRFVLNNYAEEENHTVSVPSDLLYTQSVGYKIKHLTIASNSIADYTVVCPADASESMVFAAKELVSYIKKATGVELPIVQISASDKVFELAAVADESYGDDGFTIKTENGKVLISGAAQRGVLYGVYEFLEDYVGWRFIFDDLEYVYGADALDIPNGINDTQIPVFYDRDSQSFSYNDKNLDNAVKRKINSWKNRGALEKAAKEYGLGVGYIGTAHTYERYITGITNANQPCLTDPDVYEECLTNVLNKIKSELEKGYTVPLISISQMDNSNYCICRHCYRINGAEEMSKAGTTVRFMNRISDAIHEIYPETGVWTLSYQWTREPTVTKVSDNVTIMWAYEACYNHLLNEEACSDKGIGLKQPPFDYQNNMRYNGYMQGWLNNAENVYCWYYPTNYHYYLCPVPNWDVHRENYRYLAQSGIGGIYAEGFYGSDPTEGYGFERMNVYLLAKLAWDPYMSQSEYEAITDEYLAAAYGSGWRYLREYLDMWVEAGDLSGCWMGNFNQPQEIVSLPYYSENYEKMCELFDNAEKYADTSAQAELIRKFRCQMEFLALCGDYKPMFVEGTEEQKAEYQRRYSELYNFIKTNNIPITWNGIEQLPETDVVTDTPMRWYNISGETIRN